MAWRRIRCLVPGCRRTRDLGREPTERDEWICGKHWPLVSRALRAKGAGLRRRWRRAGPKERERIAAALRWIWREMKRQATERAMGL
jgi:hypothetical protein